MEETIERIVGFFRHAAQGLEERKQMLYLLGPVGGGKSSLAERLKQLMEKEPIYVLKAGNEISPIFESPLGLFDPVTLGRRAGKALRHPAAAADRHDFALGGQASRGIRRRHHEIHRGAAEPSRLKQICVAKTEPGDENNQDVAEPGRQGRYPQARNVQPERSRRLLLLGRAQPHDARSDGIRRDVQGADQDAASALDRDAGGQLRRDREYRRHPVIRASSWRTRTRPSGRASRTTRTTKPLSTASRSSRCRTACAPPRSARSTKSCCRAASCRTRRAPRRRWTSCRGSACCRG